MAVHDSDWYQGWPPAATAARAAILFAEQPRQTR